jgi:predicted ATPase
VAEALTALDEAFATVQTFNERFVEAEVHRLRGELLGRTKDRGAEAEACFRRALEVARGQGARSLELRAALGLSRLWHHQGRTEEAQRILAPRYEWFTEGFATADLLEAKDLLDGRTRG